MLNCRSITRRALLPHALPVMVLLAMGVLNQLHIFRSPYAIGLPNTDSEGTLWWIWSNCHNFVKDDVLVSVASPQGFSTRGLGTYNLIDQGRIILSKAANCSPGSVVLVASYFPMVALLANLVSAYSLGWSLFRNRAYGLVVSVCGIATSQLLLATRTSLANNLLAPGIVSVIFLFRYSHTKRRNDFFFSCLFLTLQMLCNAYNGAMFLIASVVIHLALSALSIKKIFLSFLQVLALALSSSVGLLPLLKNHLFLLSDETLRRAYRPVYPEGEIVNPLVLISRNYRWFDQLAPATLPRPEAGWISAPLLVTWMLVLGVSLIRFRYLTRIQLASSLAAVLLLLLAFNIPGTDFVRQIYFAKFSALRGVSNYAKLVPLLMVVSCVSGVHQLVKVKKCGGQLKTSWRLLIVALVTLNVIDSLPTSATFSTRASLEPVKDFYENLYPRDQSGITAHFPDFTYDKSWGLPLRFIQLAQMYTGERVANGRTFEQLSDACMRLPTPNSTSSYRLLQSRGVTRVVLHRRLMTTEDLESTLAFFKTVHLSGVRVANNAAVAPEFGPALDIDLFEIPSPQDVAICGSTYR